MQKMTGYHRMVIIKAWIKSGRSMDREEYIKRVCELKTLEYRPPKPLNRQNVIAIKQHDKIIEDTNSWERT